MASRGAVLRGALSIPGGARPTPAPQGSQNALISGRGGSLNAPNFGQVSPLASQLANEGGYSRVYGGFLPRPLQDFTEGAFGPFSPILPVPVDQPPEGAERPGPRRYEYQVGWNLPTGQPGNEGVGKLVSFATLQKLSDTYSVARACVEFRKNQIRGIEWDIVPTPEASKAQQSSPSAQADFGKRRAKAMKFFSRPDLNYFSYARWMSAMLEEMLVYDSLTLLIKPVWGKGRGKGVLGSDLGSLELVHGPTIRPLLDLQGATPRPPAPAYQQYLYGVPRSDYMTMLLNEDIDDAGLTGREVAQFRGDQMLYLPMIPRAWTPYGFSPIERAIVPIMTGLQKQGYQYDFFSESTVPASYVIPGDTALTPNQLRELQDALNAIAGDPAWKQKIIVLPPGSHVEPQRPLQTADQLDEIVMSQVCMAFGIAPMELGILPRVSTTTSPGAANQMAKMTQNQSEDTGTTPILRFFADIFNAILQDVCGQADMMFTFEGMQQEEDQDALTGLLVQQFQNGFRTLDECRQELNLQPYGLEESSEPLVTTPNGPVPLSTAVAQAEQATAQSQASTESTQANTDATQSRQQMAEESHEVRMNEPQMPPGAAQAKPTAAAGAEGRQEAARGGGAKPPPGQPAAQAANREAASSAKRESRVVTNKGAAAELDSLARHLRKGRSIVTWEPRHLTQRHLGDVARGMAEGLTAAEAADLIKLRSFTLPASEYQWLAKDDSPQWAGWLRDTQIAELYAPKIAAAFQVALQAIRDFLSQWLAGKIRTTAQWAAQKIRELIVAALRLILTPLWTESYALGRHSARAMTSQQPVSWEGWEPGDSETAHSSVQRLRQSQFATTGLTQLTEQDGSNLVDSISETRLDNLPEMLTEALATGQSAESLTAGIANVVNAEKRCGVISQTETTRGVNCGTLDQYRDDGVERKEWLVAPDERVCKTCRANEADGSIPVSSDFTGGVDGAPQHPNCRCTVVPATAGLMDLTGFRSSPLSPDFNVVPDQDAAMTKKQHNGDGYVTCDQGHRHWGANGAAGILFRSTRPDGSTVYLLQKRAADAADHAGTWSVFGGGALPGETPWQCAQRECREELGDVTVS